LCARFAMSLPIAPQTSPQTWAFGLRDDTNFSASQQEAAAFADYSRVRWE